MFYHVNLWQENKMQYGDGIVKLFDTLWTMDKIKRLCSNADVLRNLKGINGIHIIQRFDGSFFINQISGYTDDTGLYGYSVGKNNSLLRFC